jgi:hypothetical protein
MSPVVRGQVGARGRCHSEKIVGKCERDDVRRAVLTRRVRLVETCRFLEF